MIPESVSRHDLSLAGIGSALAAGALAGLFSPLGIVLTLTIASVFAAAGVGYALFYRPPVTESRRSQRRSNEEQTRF